MTELARGSGRRGTVTAFDESVVEKKMINLVIPALRDAGATDLVEMPIAKIVP